MRENRRPRAHDQHDRAPIFLGIKNPPWRIAYRAGQKEVFDELAGPSIYNAIKGLNITKRCAHCVGLRELDATYN